MLQKPWYKIFVWFLAIFFFFLASGVIISMLRPGPNESEVMQFMASMMNAMDNSMMGVAMNLEGDGLLARLMLMSVANTIPIIAVGVAGGILIRTRNKEAK